VGQHGNASGSILLGLDGFEVLAAQVVAGEWQLEIQTTATVVGCQGCGVRAELHGRRRVRVRDLPIVGRRWCSGGASACGAVQSLRVGSAPGPSRRPPSTPGRC
jgi:hypothetical protein